MGNLIAVVLVLVVVAFFVLQVIGIISDLKERRRVKNKKSGETPEKSNKGDSEK